MSRPQKPSAIKQQEGYDFTPPPTVTPNVYPFPASPRRVLTPHRRLSDPQTYPVSPFAPKYAHLLTPYYGKHPAHATTKRQRPESVLLEPVASKKKNE